MTNKPIPSQKAWLKVLKNVQGTWGPETAVEREHRLAREQADLKDAESNSKELS
jgi:hypothetical protein